MIGSVPGMGESSTIRIGILGAARIAPAAVIGPARHVDGVAVTAVAARDRARAEAFAVKHHIGRVHDSYADLIDDPDIDAVYIPLPNGLHGTWTKRAIAAHKHVLCEKPFTANATEATQVADLADASDRVVFEAFHWRYHPLNVEVLRRVADGWFGTITRIDAAFCFPLLKRDDIRWSRRLAGGSLMDAGCYPVNMVRAVAHAAGFGEPEVRRAQGAFTSGGVDRMLHGELAWTGAATGSIRCGMFSPTHPVDIRLNITGTRGSVRVRNPLAPQLFGHAVYRRDGHRETVWAKRTPTYKFQMIAFRDAINEGTPFPSTPADAVANMAVIDALYQAAGVTPHEPTPVP